MQRVLATVASFNDAHLIGQCLEGLRAQSYPVGQVLVVDNASSDGTSAADFPGDVEFIRHPCNLGTNGTAITGLSYALENGYDWTWIFDADTVPRPDALEQLMSYFDGLASDVRQRVFFLASLPVEAQGGLEHHGSVFTEHGIAHVAPAAGEQVYRCDATIWTGTLYRTAAVRDVGLPPADYVLDFGDMEYGYRGTCRGFTGYMHRGSVLDHNLHPVPTLKAHRLGPLPFRVFHSPPIRRYYFFRNTFYFWLYEYDARSRFRIVLPHLFHLFKTWLKILLFSPRRRAESAACLRGLRDGFLRRLDRRFGTTDVVQA